MSETKTRRGFLGAVGWGMAAMGLGSRAAVAAKPGPGQADVPRRSLGRTGVEVSCIGLGGYHLGNPRDASEAVTLVHSAVDRGITFLDNCWDYHGGESERRVGQALQGGYRDAARRDGKVRFVGFTGHKSPDIHLHMLEVARAHGVRFDAVQMPINPLDWHFRSFQRRVLPELVKDGIAVLGMKPLADGHALKSGSVTAVECLHYALSMPTSVVITGCERMAILDQAVDAARTFRPLSEPTMAGIRKRTAKAAAEGKYEPFKVSTQYDGTVQNPQWLG